MEPLIQSDNYSFNDLDELYKTAAELPKVDRHEVHAHHTEDDEWELIPYRDSLWTDDGRATGVVSSNEDFYHVIQYGDILETVGKVVEQHSDQKIGVKGGVSLSPTAHRMSANIDFTGDTTVYANPDDPIDLGLKIRSGHSGFHGLKYDVGAERQVCSNGMMAFVSELGFDQTHSEPFQPGLAYNAVDAVIESPEEIEQRLAQAQEQTLVNQDEALLVLLEHGIGNYLEHPVPDLLNALYEEVGDAEAPTLWETYNAATRALTHYTRDVPQFQLDQGFEAAAALLENGYNEVPDADQLGRQTIERRAQKRIESTEDDQYWPGEDESVKIARNTPASGIGDPTITDYTEDEPLAQWESLLLPNWRWEAYEKEDEEIYFGRVKSPMTYDNWEWGYFTQDDLKQVKAYRIDIDEGELFPDGGLPEELAAVYETELDALLGGNER